MAENENKCLAKGGINEQSKYFYMKNEGKLINEIKKKDAEIEEVNDKMIAQNEKLKINEEELKFLWMLKQDNEKRIKDLELNNEGAPSVDDLWSL